jgi:hypothetical protein
MGLVGVEIITVAPAAYSYRELARDNFRLLPWTSAAGAFAVGHPGRLMTSHIRFDRVSRRARIPPGFRITKEAHA